MTKSAQRRLASISVLLCVILAGAAGLLLIRRSAGSEGHLRIAVIPQTEGVNFWDSAHVGAAIAARESDASIYWNAPMREDDIEAQIALVESVIHRRFNALVLAPDHPLALVTPVQRALARGIPTVIIGSSLSIAPSSNLASVLNDDEKAGVMAADRAAQLLHGRGTIAIIGINPSLAGTTTRARALEHELARTAPGILVVDRRAGSYNVPREQQVVEEVLRAHPQLDVLVALMWDSADGAIRAIDSMKTRPKVKLIAFDAYAAPPFDHCPNLDSVIQEDIRGMAQRAVEIAVAKERHQYTPSQVELAPTLITRENANSMEIRQMFSTDLPANSWHWSSLR